MLIGAVSGAPAFAQWNTYQPRRPAPAAPFQRPQNGMAAQPFGAAPSLPQDTQPYQAETDETTAEDKPKYGPPPQPEAIAEPRKADDRNYIAVKLQGLDKVTARRQRFEAQMGTVTSFGNLEIVPRACWQSPADEQPESAALLEIWQWKPGEKPSFVFFGWMFASSPALSSLEHPIYDVTVLGCIEAKKPKKDKKDGKKE